MGWKETKGLKRGLKRGLKNETRLRKHASSKFKRKLDIGWLATWICDSDETFVSWPCLDEHEDCRS